MSRTLAAALAAHVSGGVDTSHTLCAMLRLDLVDGPTLAFTDHDLALSFDLGDGAVSYSPGTGILPSDLQLSTGFNPDDMEVSGPIGDVVTRAAVIGGRFDDAEVRYFSVNWSDPGQGAIKLVKGRIVLAEVLGGKFKFTIHSDVGRFAQSIGRVITAYCDADFGDSRCAAVPVSVTGTVTAVTDERGFTVSFAGSFADDFYNRGTVIFLTGALAGTRPVEIFDWGSTGAITLWTGLAEAPAIGDTLTIKQGCAKIRAACLVYDNVVNFRGFPDVPGTDQVLKYPTGAA